MRLAPGFSRVLTLPLRKTGSSVLKPNAAVSESAISVVENSNGLQYVCLPKPNAWNGLARIAAIFNAGSRFESDPRIHGITHLIRRSCGISTTNYTAVNLTRHVQQMGCRLHCHTTREHMIYTADVAPNLAHRAGLILATMATQTAFYDWELKDQVYKLMKKDIDMLNRRRFDVLTVELLHEAAYGQHPHGVGLGNSLFADINRIGTYTVDDIEAFLNSHYTPANALFIVTGCGPNFDGIQICDTMNHAALFRTPTLPITSAARHTFVGGERRREMTGSETTYAALAWPTSGGHMGERLDSLVLSIFATALTSPCQSIAFGSTGGLVPPTSGAVVTPIHFTYSDHGLFGILVTGTEGKVVGDQLVLARKALCKLAETGMNEEQFERAKARFKGNLALRMENINFLAEDIAVQLLCCNRGGNAQCSNDSGIRSIDDIYLAVDRLGLTEVNKVFKDTVKSTRMALSTVGTNVAYVPPLETLKTV